MIESFKDQATEDLFNGVRSKKALKIPQQLWPSAIRKLDMINAAVHLDDLKAPPGNQLQRLKGDLGAFHSIRVNEQYRIIFKWDDHNAKEVQITDYH